jgi:hypothetical protein
MEFSLISLKALIKIFGKIYFQRLVMLSSCFYDVGLFVEGCLFDWKYLKRVWIFMRINGCGLLEIYTATRL